MFGGVNLVGAITLIGLLWILLRFRTRTVAVAMGATVVTVYLFCLLSMLLTAMGTTLLSFRLEPILVCALAAAGVFGVVDIAHWAVRRFGDVRVVVGAVAVLAAIAAAQSIPGHLARRSPPRTPTPTDTESVRMHVRPAPNRISPRSTSASPHRPADHRPRTSSSPPITDSSRSTRTGGVSRD